MRRSLLHLALALALLGAPACGSDGESNAHPDVRPDIVADAGDPLDALLDLPSDDAVDGDLDAPVVDADADDDADMVTDSAADRDADIDAAEITDDLDAADEADTTDASDEDGLYDASDEDASDDADADADQAPEPPVVLFPRTAITPAEVGVIVNTSDTLSAQIAAYYVAARGLSEDNVLEVTMGTSSNLSAVDFAAVETAIDDAFGPEIQALVLTSLHPYRIDCMGVSAAVALGFDLKYCQDGPPCLPTASVDYYNSDSTTPYTDHGLRPTMILAAETLDEAQALIDRGIAADGSYPTGEGWFVRTTDSARSVRWPDFSSTVTTWDRADALSMTYVDNSDGSGSNVLNGETNILFYFTGLSTVADIATNTYVPGAVADHLTSFGGALPGGGQMSILAWLQAGATAAFGTAREPCNYTSKFPRTSVFVRHYFRGETVIEAYWKSVHWPGEGNFVGEPLARPYGPPVVEWTDGSLSIETTMLLPGLTYALESASTAVGPWTPELESLEVAAYRFETIVLDDAWAPFYRLVEEIP